MAESDILNEVRGFGESRADIVSVVRASPLAPGGKELTPSALGMWFTRGRVPLMWRSAVLERLGRIDATSVAQ